ncbi:transposase [Pediococcus argentinicus]|uniref:Transposase n=1 Tax=Pediococcus argentinicus TaxID=480391 RepID=A0A0R2NJN4_9LACO|nr:transposase [Pediococcus argentinicus]KRO25983.1 transposase [Pediococcus argentinicus]NKZ21768.1 transposase [Pediococcus argentinicus]GEP18974.1 hypothetical protein LSA03_03580 [Pediococcus argentinicus]
MDKKGNTNKNDFVLNFDLDIPKDHIARAISNFVDSIPDQLVLERENPTGRPAIHPRMLMKMIIFAYYRQEFSGRDIELLNEESIPMKWLSQDTSVSYKTINNFKSSEPFKHLIKEAFVYFSMLLVESGVVKEKFLFIPGIELKVHPDDSLFTWKRAVDEFGQMDKTQVATRYEDLIEKAKDNK